MKAPSLFRGWYMSQPWLIDSFLCSCIWKDLFTVENKTQEVKVVKFDRENKTKYKSKMNFHSLEDSKVVDYVKMYYEKLNNSPEEITM